MSIQDMTRSLFSPHGRAERLIDAQLDAARGEGVLSDADETWLERHIAECVDCRAVREERRALLGVMADHADVEAPEGFAGRVLMAAKARGREAPVAEEIHEPVLGRRYALGGLAAVAAGLGLFAFAASHQPEPALSTKGQVHVMGRAAEIDVAPHFTVRAPGIGAAQLRAQIAEIATQHGGELVTAEGAVLVHLPRAELVGVVQDLARRGRYKVSRADGEDVGPDVETIVVRFELD